MKAFLLPSLGSDMDQGKLLKWLVKPGDTVRRGQIVAVVDTSKAAVDVETWDDGQVAALLVEPGQTIPVGMPMALLAAGDETVDAAAIAAAKAAMAPALPTAAVSTAVQAAPLPSAGAGAAAPASAGRRRISPAARKHAQDLGIDIDTLSGTGPDGALTLQDVERAARGAAPAPTPEAVAGATRAAAMQQAIGAAMSRSKREIPHYYLSEQVPLLRASRWLEQANAQRALPQRLLMAVLQIKAVALAAAAFPELNGFHVGGGHRPSQAVHVGVAISLRSGGLIAPALHDAANRTLDELMAALSDLVKRARAGSLRSSEMSDPTITLTNLGERGVDSVHGVIYPPQVALVGFGRIADRVWADDGAIRIMPVVTATLAADHRVSDGHRGAAFLSRIAGLLQSPEQL
ncbi:dihydrolipoamide acetyltransferase family protein [Lacisediminimonas profundi]|uniref:dihydrolipoamide acetyltransferase family protein n=1 Tax=Lacisediminimonas profundi TaxID=2603856 RepID=UPI00124AFE58|nr:dihydrolipoamide acetyltransferase family protein [Lacisediminimonas profundi]